MRFSADYPARDLNRLTMAFRLITVLPVAALGAWFAILLTGRYPRGLFGFVEGVIGCQNRVAA